MFSVIFPGQGSQMVGMGKEFYDKFDLVKNLFKEADDTLNFSISKLILEGPKDELDLTANTQPAIFLISYSIYNVIKKEFNIDLNKAKFLCSLPKSLGINPENQKEITLNTGRFGPYLKCENKSARIENVEEIFSIGLNRAITLIAEAKPGRMSSSIIKDLGEHPEDKKPVRIMKGQYGPYIKYKSLNATIPEEKDPVELTMEEALMLIEKRREYDKNKKSKGKKKK